MFSLIFNRFSRVHLSVFAGLLLCVLSACQTAQPRPSLPPDWQLSPLPGSQLMVAFPSDWYLHDGGKMVEITPHSQPLWSSFADPHATTTGPHINLLHNLNRQMGDTPEEEIEFILQGYPDLEPHQLAAPLAGRPDVWLGSYRFSEDPEAMFLLVGAVAIPQADFPQQVVDLVTVVSEEERAIYQPIFEEILRSIQLQ